MVRYTGWVLRIALAAGCALSCVAQMDSLGDRREEIQKREREIRQEFIGTLRKSGSAGPLPAGLRQNLLWLIQNAPDSLILGTAEGILTLQDQPEFDRALELWQALAKQKDAPPRALANAAASFRSNDLHKALTIAWDGLERYPENSDLEQVAGQLDGMALIGITSLSRIEHATKVDPLLATSEDAVRAQRQLENSQDATLLASAGRFLHTQHTALLMIGQPAAAKKALEWAQKTAERATVIDPKTGGWVLAMIYQRLAIGKPPKERIDLLEKALALPATSLNLALLELPEAYLDAGDLEKAGERAQELLKQGEAVGGKRNEDAIHRANTALGLVALRRGDKAEAGRRLLASGRVSTSPVLGSFGPRWTLAKALLDAGESALVLDYIALCKNFWRMDRGRLDQWAQMIRSGGKPDFTGPMPAEMPEAVRTRLVGRPAPDFRLPGLDGKPVELKQFRGKTVLLDYWATWCAPCRAEMPSFEKLHRELGSKNVVILALNVGEDENVVRGYLDKEKLTMPVVLDRDEAVTKQYGVNAYPTLVVINGEGMITEVAVGGRPESQLRMLAAGKTLGMPPVHFSLPPAHTPEEFFREASRLTREKQYSAAATQFSEALRLRPEWVAALQGRASAYYELKQHDKAIADWSEVIRLRPQLASAWDRRGLSQSYSGHHDLAIGDYSKAIELAPESAAAYNNRGWALMSLGRLHDAQLDLDQALELNPAYSLALENRIQLALQRNQYDRALADCEAVLRLDPAAQWALRRREEILEKIAPVKQARLAAPELAAPELVAPAEGAVFDHIPRKTHLSWKAVEGATGYVIETDYFYSGVWDTEANRHSGVIGRTPDTEFDVDFVGAQPGRWRVWAVDASGAEGVRSPWRTFRYTR